MRSSALVLAASLFAFSAAQNTFYDIPQCAASCFMTAVMASGCEISDSYCQCTEGEEAIKASTIPCLCSSDCTSADLLKVQQVSNNICSVALASSSESYAAATMGLDVCQATSGASGRGSGAGTTTARSSEASATGKSSGSGSEDASASASASQSVEAQSGNAAAPAVTGMVSLQGAVIGLAGLGLLAL